MIDSDPLTIEVLTTPSAAWLSLRGALWPHDPRASHQQEVRQFLAEPARLHHLMAVDPSGQALGFIEGSIRSDYVNGTTSSPVGYIEGLYVIKTHRRLGVARRLIDALSVWFTARHCTEMASDTAPSNLPSIATHLALGFEETERSVFFKKRIAH